MGLRAALQFRHETATMKVSMNSLVKALRASARSCSKIAQITVQTSSKFKL